MYLELAFSKQEPLNKLEVKVTLIDQDLGDLAKAVANTDKRVRALEVVLCNCVKYQYSKYPILYSRSHSKYPSEKINPNFITARPLIDVIDALGDHRFIGNDPKKNRWGKAPEPDAEDIGYTSEFWIMDDAIKLAKLLGIKHKTIYLKETTHLRLKPYTSAREGIRSNEQFLDFEDDSYTTMAEAAMKLYSDYMMKQKIQAVFEDGRIHIEPMPLRRQYRDYDNSRSLIYGGRCYPYWTTLSSIQRKHIKINNNKTVSLDFKSSQIRWLYLWHLGEKLDLDYDAYDLEVNGHKINRDIVKKMNIYLLNLKSPLKQTKSLNYWHKELDGDGKKKKDGEWSGAEQARIYEQTMKLKGVTPATMRNAYLNKHDSIRQYFLQGTKGGQFSTWIESNVVYNIAKEATLKGIPCLTIHDEFLVEAKHQQEMEKLMNNHTTYDDTNMKEGEPFDYRGYYKWREYRGEEAPPFKDSMTIEF